MALTNYKYKEGDGVLHSISEGYKQDDWGIPGAIGGFGEYVKNNKWKTAAVVGVVVAVPLMAAYFLSPAYAGFVNTTAASTYAGTMAGVKGLYALAAANPVFTGLLTTAIVVTIGTFIYMNLSKANQIEKACELLKDENPTSKIDELKEVFGISQEKTTAPTPSQ
ncbi:hypothetical protein [Wolbachia pipientis]|uniref:hypothetical protein n=1 Tax=Wolbachia pipientis TaxID=955 RepID=UPI00202E06AC|nr:hypothetical protein [Wolbachia pipientis]MCM1002162.1 hypothetical protein [Wolbachia pipientis]